MIIKILSSGCATCKALFESAENAVKELGIQAEVMKEEDMEKITEYDVTAMPGLVINEELVAMGKGITTDQIKELISERSN